MRADGWANKLLVILRHADKIALLMAGSKLSETAARLAGSPWAVSVVTVVVRLAVFKQLLPVQGTQGFYKYNEQARIAWAIVSGYGFSSPWINTPLLPTAQQPPLYPWFLAGLFKLTGPYSYTSLWFAELLNVIFAAMTAVLVIKIGKQIFGAAVGTLAAWVWACWLDEAVVGLRVWESSLSAFLLALSVWLVLRLKATSPFVDWISFGILAGISALANTSLLSIFVGFWFWLFIKDRLPHVGKILLSVFFCFLTLLPWTARNYAEFHRLLPVRDNFGFELWQGNHIGTHDVIAEFNRLGEIGFMEAKRDTGVQFILENQQRFWRRCGDRFFHFWSDPYVWEWLPVSILTWAGCVLSMRSKGWQAMPLVIPIVIFPMIYYITHPGVYRHPIEPVMLLLSAFTVITIVRRVSQAISSSIYF